MELGGSTYDSVQGWLIWGTWWYYDYDGSSIDYGSGREVFSIETTKDGRLFEPFPSPRGWKWNGKWNGKVYLESLNNGGDIFAMGSGKEETYIFRENSSTWERQADSPLAGPAYSKGKLKNAFQVIDYFFYKSSYQQLSAADLLEQTPAHRFKKLL